MTRSASTDYAEATRRARRELLRAGASAEQVFALELALLRQIMGVTEDGDNWSEFIAGRIEVLKMALSIDAE